METSVRLQRVLELLKIFEERGIADEHLDKIIKSHFIEDLLDVHIADVDKESFRFGIGFSPRVVDFESGYFPLYPVTVLNAGKRTIQVLSKMGRYAHFDGRITDESCGSVDGDDCPEIQVSLFPSRVLAHQKTYGKDVIAACGYRQIKNAELISLDIKYPTFQFENAIFGLGDLISSSGGGYKYRIYCNTDGEDSGRRCVFLHDDREKIDGSHHLIAAVKL